MDWKIDKADRAKEATNNLIFMNIYPTVGLFKAFYFNENILIEKNIYKDYVNYLYKFSFRGKDGKIHGADYFTTWDKERKNASKNIE